MNRILLRQGTLVDGTGAPPVSGDILIAGDRIAEIGAVQRPADCLEIDCRGLTISPGFIDAHSHSDLQVLQNKTEKLVQGVTTEVVGNCGFSACPAPQDRTLLQDFGNGILCGGGIHWGWESAEEYLSLAGCAKAANVVSLIGHGSLRIAHAGLKQGPLSEHELDAMEGNLSQALSQGACGFSTGLMYAPGSSAPFEELERLCRVVARHQRIYTSHIRDYSGALVEAVEEQLELARRTGCRLQISHFQAAGKRHWHQQVLALEKIEKAKCEGLDVAFDCYPYTHGSTVLTQILPQWTLDGGISALLVRLSDKAGRSHIEQETAKNLVLAWEDIFIASVDSESNRDLIGKSIAEIAEERGCEPAAAVMDLLLEEEGRVNILELNQSEENLRQTLSHPLSIVITDGVYVNGRPHPRLYGTFPTLLGEMCRNRRWLTMEEAIRKVTDYPAQRFGIRERGRLASGYFADITVFDPDTVASPATYTDPQRSPVGIRYVFRNGNLLVS